MNVRSSTGRDGALRRPRGHRSAMTLPGNDLLQTLQLSHNRGGAGLMGASKESTPFVFSFRLNTLSPQVA